MVTANRASNKTKTELSRFRLITPVVTGFEALYSGGLKRTNDFFDGQQRFPSSPWWHRSRKGRFPPLLKAKKATFPQFHYSNVSVCRRNPVYRVVSCRFLSDLPHQLFKLHFGLKTGQQQNVKQRSPPFFFMVMSQKQKKNDPTIIDPRVLPSLHVFSVFAFKPRF